MKPNSIRSWERVRAEIGAHLSRCEVAPAQHPAPVDKAVAFSTDLMEPYYGPTREARAAVNLLFGFDAAAGQLEWEAEFANPDRVEQALQALADFAHNMETRSALALLLLDRADRMGAFGSTRTELLTRIGWQLRRDPQVQARMRYLWTHMEASPPVLEALS
jgi:hypothetical protein